MWPIVQITPVIQDNDDEEGRLEKTYWYRVPLAEVTDTISVLYVVSFKIPYFKNLCLHSTGQRKLSISFWDESF